MPENLLKNITYSRISAFVECPMKEYWSYRVEGVGIKSTAPYKPFIVGDLLHYALAKFHDPQCQRMLRQNMINRVHKVIDAMGPLDPEKLNDMMVGLHGMVGACLGYKERYAGDKDNYETLFVEKAFAIERQGVVIRGKIDWGVKTKQNKTMFVEEKSTADSPSMLLNKYALIPLNAQGLIYAEGFKSLTGEYPDLMCWDYVVKTALRQKGSPEKGNVEPLEMYIDRVQAQYMEEPEKKFFRTPPLPVDPNLIKEVWKYLDNIILKMQTDVPYMNFNCLGMFGTPCPFADACTSKLKGMKDGWNAGSCMGLYKLKEHQHEELDGTPLPDDDDVVTEEPKKKGKVSGGKEGKKARANAKAEA